MNIKDMYSVFEHNKGKFAIRMLAWNNFENEQPHWSYLYLTDGIEWIDIDGFGERHDYVHKFKYFSSKKEAQDYINYITMDGRECF